MDKSILSPLKSKLSIYSLINLIMGLIKPTKVINIISVPFIFVFISEIFPLRTSGSFFTTWNATAFWLNIGILYSFINYKKINN